MPPAASRVFMWQPITKHAHRAIRDCKDICDEKMGKILNFYNAFKNSSRVR